MKSKLQVIQEKRGAYERRRRKMFARMRPEDISIRSRLIMAHTERKKRLEKLPATYDIKVENYDKPKLGWFAKLKKWVKSLFTNSLSTV